MDASKGKESSFGLSYPLLTKTNYTAWALKMKVFMQAHGVWESIEPKDPKVAVEDKMDKRALAIIYQGISEDLLLSIAEKKTSKEAWEAIKTVHLGADKVKKAKAQTLKVEFETLTMKETEQLDEFCMRLNSLVTNIRALGEKIEEAYVVKKLLRAVPTKFLQIASAIEQFGNLEVMSVEEVVGSLKAHEERLRGPVESSGEQQLLLTEEEWMKREGKDGQLLLTREEWLKRTNRKGKEFTRGARDRSKVRCFNCSAYGHYAAECRKPKREGGQRNEVNLTQTNDDEPTLLLAKFQDTKEEMIMLNEGGVIPRLSKEKCGESSVWYLDNGASNHMTGQRSKFTELDEGVIGEVKFGDGSTVKIQGKGSIRFATDDGKECVLKEVYFIPNLCNNIISLGQLSENGSKVVIEGEYLWVYDGKGKLLMKVRKSTNRLYKVIIKDEKSTCLLTKAEENSWLWHARLGHVNFPAIILMSKNKMALGLPEITHPKSICEGCLMSKQTRRPFPSQTDFTAKERLELVHGDICGPISPPTLTGNKYFLLFVDDFSRAMWVYMIKSKDEAFSCFKKFRVLVEKESKQEIKVLRTDRGGEFCSNEFVKYCEDVGIVRHYTAPYSPQQNGVVERRNRTVVAMGRSLLKERDMPSYMWAEAIRHAVYLLNRLPTRAVSGETPYEAWTKKKPRVDYLKVFGCIAYMKVPNIHVKKLDNRSKRVVHLGREAGTKAYRLYSPETGVVHISRDIVFEEAKGWPWKETEVKGSLKIPSPSFFIIAGSQVENIPGEEGSSQSEFQEGGEEHNILSTPQSQRSSSRQTDTGGEQHESDESDDGSNSPRNFRLISDIYNETEEIEITNELLLAGIDEPVCYGQAIKEDAWKNAMDCEIEAIERNGTWELTDLPTGHKAIDLKWVYKLKRDTNGEILKHNARLVAKGYVQKQGIDFEEAFAPVTRLETVRLLLALAAKNEWEVHHLDVKSAFLNGKLYEEVYVNQPEGYVKEGHERKVYKLFKALYGLRQAPRAWYTQLNKCLEKLGFTKCPLEHAVYTKREGDESLIIGVYVDDLIITGTSVANIVKFKNEMSREFEMSDLGKLSYYLGIEVNQGKGYIELKQTAYAKKVLEKAGMRDCNSVKYPMEPKIQMHKDENGKPVNPTEFKSMVGGLRYLVHTRPDIAYAVGVVSRFMERPTTLHQNAVKRILRYVKGTLSYGLMYTKGRGNYLLSGFSDSDLAGDIVDRKSTGGMAFYLDESLITWVSQKQRCVALSSCEAEFMAATAAACQGMWLHRLLSQISDIKAGPVVLYIDNKSAIDLARNPVFHGRSKHIDVRYHFIRECVENGSIVIKHVSTDQQRADVLTKAMSITKFEKMRKLLGIRDLSHV